MSRLKILGVRGHGDQDEEVVVLQAEQECNLGHYALVDSTFTKGHRVSNKHRHLYRFPASKVKPGDYVHLYTGHGADDRLVDQDGDVHHTFYWRLDLPVWNDDGDVAVLLVVADAQRVASA